MPAPLVDLIRPEGCNPDRGLLTLRPSHHAAATQARMVQQQLTKHLNTQLGRPPSAPSESSPRPQHRDHHRAAYGSRAARAPTGEDEGEHRDAARELDRLAAVKAAEKEASRQAAIARARDEKASRHPRSRSGAA
ncbi:hypothetical protein ACWDV7_20545 [Streptomyces sp. NPDC003362]